jgi:glycosyltransferase involved in cell wall biosynthesis
MWGARMAERARVVWDALLLRPQPTGVGRAILELARAMAAEDRGLDFTVLCTHPEMLGWLAGREGWRLRVCPEARGGTLRKALHTQLRLPAVVRDEGARLFHSLQFVAPLRVEVPRVVTVHDLSFLRFPRTVEEPRRSYYRFFVPPTLRRADRIVTNSEATAEEVAAFFPMLRARLRVTLFGTPSWVWQEEPAASERPAAAPLLFVGTLEPRKNLPRLLEAYSLLVYRRQASGRPPPPDLVLAGAQGWHERSLRRRLGPLLATGKVRLEGYCDRRRLWQLYRSARALLFPSLHEGFGFPILEAMAARLPVLTSDRGAMREVAAGGALLCDPEDGQSIAAAIDRLCDDEELGRRLTDRGWARARQCDWSQTADRTAAVYHELLGRGG